MALVAVPEILPTRRVTFKVGGHSALINVKDFNPALHAPVDDAPGDVDRPVVETVRDTRVIRPARPKRKYVRKARPVLRAPESEA
jgi:hypothetical protein